MGRKGLDWSEICEVLVPRKSDGRVINQIKENCQQLRCQVPYQRFDGYSPLRLRRCNHLKNLVNFLPGGLTNFLSRTSSELLKGKNWNTLGEGGQKSLKKIILVNKRTYKASRIQF